MPPMLTPPQVAKLLGVNPDKVRAWIISGELKAINVATRQGLGRPRYRIEETELEAFKLRRSVLPPPKIVRRRKPVLPAGWIDFFAEYDQRRPKKRQKPSGGAK